MSRNRDGRGYRNTSDYKRNASYEKTARDQAYEEYLRLRENTRDRGNYVKNDDLYGAYFPKNYERTPIEETPYGRSEMRRRSQAQQQRQQRQEQQRRSEAQRRSEPQQKKRNKQIAKQGRVNKADVEKPVRSKRNKKKQKSRKTGNGLRIATIAVLILVLGIGGAFAAGIVAVKNTLDNVSRIELDPTMIGINPQVDEELKNYRNIAILGIDARDMSSDADTRSDAVIIASINKETKEIKMFSIYRDTMLYQGEDLGLDKITHAYSSGGPTKVLYTINKNLDLNVKEVVIVNWKAVADTVDALGGIDVDIQSSEISEMNKYIIDTYNNIGGSNELIDGPGMQTLNGNQAVTYARIRKDAATGDYRRNERMKIVIKATFNEAVKLDPKAIKKISKDIMPQIKTNMSTADMMGIALKLTSYQMTDSEGFPYEHKDWSGNAFYCIPTTLKSNVTMLHEQFFAQPGYDPTEEVKTISDKIINKTGVQ